MARKILISETTREERIQIVMSSLSWGDECDGLSGWSSGVDAMYQPYIDGELELSECNARAASTSYVQSDHGRISTGACVMGY